MPGTFSYGFDPSGSNLDAVRFLVGDTDSSDPLLYDAEIAWLIGQNGASIYAAGAQACDTIAAKLARLADTTVDDVSVKLSQRAAGYQKLGGILRQQVATSVTPWAGGTSVADKETREEDSDRAEPFFDRRTGMVPPELAVGPRTDGDLDDL